MTETKIKKLFDRSLKYFISLVDRFDFVKIQQNITE